MLLSHTAEYALRAMAWLASRPGNEPVRAMDLAVATEIPAHYLSKILRRLVLDGLLTSQKGHGGGFALARPPGHIRFVEILAAVDAAPVSNVCAFGWGRCDATHPCPLHDAWDEMSRDFSTWANSKTLADLTPIDEETRSRRER